MLWSRLAGKVQACLALMLSLSWPFPPFHYLQLTGCDCTTLDVTWVLSSGNSPSDWEHLKTMRDFFKAAGEGGSEGEAFVKWRKSKREREMWGRGSPAWHCLTQEFPLLAGWVLTQETPEFNTLGADSSTSPPREVHVGWFNRATCIFISKVKDSWHGFWFCTFQPMN